MHRAIAAVALVAACSHPAPPRSVVGEAVHGPAPKLVVLLVLDQWPEWAFEAKRAALTGGFARLLREGAWHVGQHPSAATLTGPGHALLGTGETPDRSGVMANEWWHRELGKSLTSVESPDGAKSSAVWLRVPGLGDAVAAGHGGKAVSVALKERAALLPLGHAGTAIWYDRKVAAFVGNAAPAWLAEYGAAHPVAAHLHDVWTPLASVAALAGVADDRPGEVGIKGFGATFPHALADTKDPADAIFAAPIGNELTLEVALAAIAGEQLGADAAPDLLVVSLSPHDYIGHGWGHESWEAWDEELRLDQGLARFLDQLDARVGAGRWAMIATSDHGAAPLPESVHGGRITFEQLAEAANKAAATELGGGQWVVAARYPTLYLSPAALALPEKTRAPAIRKIILALRAFPGIERVERTADFAGHCETRGTAARVLCRMLDAERSGEIVYLPAPGWILEEADEPLATAHGSSQPYDRLVPLIMLPPGRSAHAAATAPEPELVDLARVAPILATWLGVPAPATLPR